MTGEVHLIVSHLFAKTTQSTSYLFMVTEHSFIHYGMGASQSNNFKPLLSILFYPCGVIILGIYLSSMQPTPIKNTLYSSLRGGIRCNTLVRGWGSKIVHFCQPDSIFNECPPPQDMNCVCLCNINSKIGKSEMSSMAHYRIVYVACLEYCYQHSVAILLG